MQLKQAKFQIGNYTYEATQLGAITGRKLWLRLAKTLGHLLPLLVGSKVSISGLLSGEGELPDGILDKVPEFLEKLKEEDLELFWSAYCERLWVLGPGGRTQVTEEFFDVHFSGDYVSMMRLFLELTKFNFGGFLAGSAPKGGAPAEISGP